MIIEKKCENECKREYFLLWNYKRQCKAHSWRYITQNNSDVYLCFILAKLPIGVYASQYDSDGNVLRPVFLSNLDSFVLYSSIDSVQILASREDVSDEFV
ncbi:hypothetical protein DERF_000547 [Dermatophagoides farinae]|uniref:Uncharacterized protein n=1 Tax=Dermatophagoides farinae TaxID=6954 RepID=A0A922L8R9_DERFA|nr:hypothetical protein DERF_000547 [Dermatophagoides farinae]